MDIEYLLFLQGLRETAPAWLNQALEFVSELVMGPLVLLLPAVVFWCVSKSSGSFLFWGIGLGRSMNALLKNTACVYRPWIRDERVQSSLMTTATGYSFPSGHTTIATALYGGSGLQIRKHTGKTWPFLLCLVPALVTGFARNWVGAHTPQDVAVGFLVTLAVLFAEFKLMSWIEKNPQKDGLVVAVALLASAALLVYVWAKPYPEDFAADGSLIVDGHVMNKDAFGDVGFFVGTVVAWLAERRFVRFEVVGVPVAQRVVRAVAGCLLALAFNSLLLSPLQAVITSAHAAKFVVECLRPIFLVFIYPALFAFVERRIVTGKKSTQG